ncbi:MAG: hypothetical protein V7K21_03930 [Nostoc sp.]
MGILEAVEEEARSLFFRLLKRLFGEITEERGSVSFGVVGIEIAIANLEE